MLEGLTIKKNKLGTEYHEDYQRFIINKQCTNCKEIKASKDFRNAKNGLGGMMGNCKSCIGLFEKKKRVRVKEEKELTKRELERKQQKIKKFKTDTHDVKYTFVDNIIADFYR